MKIVRTALAANDDNREAPAGVGAPLTPNNDANELFTVFPACTCRVVAKDGWAEHEKGCPLTVWIGRIFAVVEQLRFDARLAHSVSSSSPTPPTPTGGEPCPTCGCEVRPEMGDGDYSCAACGFGMKEPCEHWKAMLAQLAMSQR